MSAHAWTVFCGIAGALGIAAGAGLLLVPGRLLHERTWGWRWLFEIDLIALLDRRQTIERPLYRHHRAFGAAVIVGGAILLLTLLGLRNHPLVIGTLPAILGAWGARAAILAAWALVIFVVGVGMLLFIRPSALKGFEAAANRWIEPFPPTAEPSGERLIPRCVRRVPRLSALILLAAGIACLAVATIN